MPNRSRCARRSLVLALLLAGACQEQGGGSRAVWTADSDAGVARRWFDQLAAAAEAESLNGSEASRRFGYAGVTLYEAVVPGMAEHRSLAGQLTGLGALPASTIGAHHWPAVANAALARVLDELFAGASPATRAGLRGLEAELARAFAAEIEPDTLERSIQDGKALGAALSSWIARDGYDVWNDCAFSAPPHDGVWLSSAPDRAGPLEPCWGNLRPFVLLLDAPCAPSARPPFSREPDSSFAREMREVHELRGQLDEKQEGIARFWAEGVGLPSTPGRWIRITGAILAQEEATLALAAEAYARVGIALADASVSCSQVVYDPDLQRPEAYIHDPLGPIGDAGWTSLLPTPPFVEFSSCQATHSGAAAEALTTLFGELAFRVRPLPDIPARAFASPRAAATEAALSCLYAGTQVRSLLEGGLELGACSARAALAQLQFRRML